MRALMTVIFLFGCPAAQKGLVEEEETDNVGLPSATDDTGLLQKIEALWAELGEPEE